MERMIKLLAASLLALNGSAAFAQASNPQDTEAKANAQANAGVQANTGEKSQESSSLAAGTAINAELNQSLDSKKMKVGDSVTARTTEAVKEDGKVVLRKGAKLTGHVTKASARGKGDSDSTLAVQFDRAELKGGQEMPLQVNVQAVAAAPGATPIGGDDLQGMNGAGAPSGGGTTDRGAMSGPVGGVAGKATGTVDRTTQGTAGTVRSTANGAASVGVASPGAVGGPNASGELTPASRGVFGIGGLNLDTSASGSAQGSVITSSGRSVHLDGGTRLLLVAQAQNSASIQR